MTYGKQLSFAIVQQAFPVCCPPWYYKVPSICLKGNHLLFNDS